MEWQELVLVGVLALQQQLFGATRRQRNAGGGEPAAEAPGRPAGLRQQLPLLSRCHELAAHPHVWNLLPAARRTHVHDLEQVYHDPFGAASARLCRWGALGFSGAAAADGSVPTRVALFDGDEDLPLRKGPALAKSSQALVAESLTGDRKVTHHASERCSILCLKRGPFTVPLVRSHPVSPDPVLTVSEGSAEHLICTG